MKCYLFIDESGDPFFFGNRNKLLFGTDGFQPYLIIGLIQTKDRKVLRMPELSIIDYLIWAVQRKLLKGEGRYFEALKNKYISVLNLYELS